VDKKIIFFFLKQNKQQIMEKVLEKIKTNRPNLSHSSINTYGYIIKKLLKKLNLGENEWEKILQDPKKVMDVLKDESPQSRKSILAVLISLFGKNEKTELFNEQMIIDANTYSQILKSQKKSEKQRANWLSWNEVMATYNNLYKHLSPLLKKDPLTKKDLVKLVDLVMLAVYVLIPPRRSTDYIQMKIRNFDTTKDNYLDLKKGVFVFNNYKTDKTYGRVEVKLSPKLKTLLKKWVGLNPTDYLLFDTKMNPLSSSRLTLKMNNLFDKQISSTMIRHIYITDVVMKDAPSIAERQRVASDMGHDMQTAELVYRKVD
jgi:integrase